MSSLRRVRHVRLIKRSPETDLSSPLPPLKRVYFGRGEFALDGGLKLSIARPNPERARPIDSDAKRDAPFDENPDILLILAKAAHCSRLTTKALLLMRVAGRGMAAHDIEAALASFDRLTVETANRIINYYVKRQTSTASQAKFRAEAASTMAAVA